MTASRRTHIYRHDGTDRQANCKFEVLRGGHPNVLIETARPGRAPNERVDRVKSGLISRAIPRYGGARPQHNARNGLMTASRPTQINRHDATDTLSVAIPAKVRPWLCSALIGVDRLVVLSSRLRLSELISRAIQPSALR